MSEPLTGEAVHCQTVDGHCSSHLKDSFYALPSVLLLFLSLSQSRALSPSGFHISHIFHLFFCFLSHPLPFLDAVPAARPHAPKSRGEREQGLKKRGALVKAGMSHLTKMESRVGGGGD